MSRRVVLLGLLVLGQGAIFLTLAPRLLGLSPDAIAHGLTTFPLDDAYIHHVYAEGLRFGDGLSYLPGVPAAGSTSPLFAAALVPLQLLPDPHWVLATKALGLLLLWLVAALAARVAETAGARAATYAGALVASSPPLALAALSGMEVLLAAAFALLALLVAPRVQTPRGALALGAVLAGAVLTRPELGLLWIGVTVWVARRRALPPTASSADDQRGRPDSNLEAAAGVGGESPAVTKGLSRARAHRLALLAAAPALVGLAGWAAWNLHATGSPWPTTFLAKHAAPSFAARWRDLHWAYAAIFGAPLFALAAPLAGLGGRDLFRRGQPLLVAFVVVMPLGLAWAHDLREPFKLYWLRYALPVLPALLVLIAVGVATLPERMGRARTALGAGALLLSLASTPAAARHHAESCRNIAELNVAAAEWLSANSSPNDWIASNDAGAVRRLTGRPVVDLIGLNDHLALRDRAARLRETSPRFYVVFPSWFPALVESPRTREVRRFRSTPYEICARCEQTELVILEAR